MSLKLKAPDALDLWRRTLVETVRRDQPDLSARQLALMLTVYLTPPPHTVRGLAGVLNISKPAVTRALDRLSALDYVRRKTDEADRRNVLVQRTVKGSVYLSDFAELVIAAAGGARGESGGGSGTGGSGDGSLGVGADGTGGRARGGAPGAGARPAVAGTGR